MTNVRVRIAPSPTGTPHVGTAYIALFNYLFARANDGTFILRIEDTDRTRSHKKYEDELLDALRWIGLSWDEGPDVGGDHGPYRQSDRTAIYSEYIKKLLDAGHAYHCFCTPERLNEMRAKQRAGKEGIRYDRKCLGLSDSDVKHLMDDDVPFVVRLKVPEEGTCVFKDRLRGEIKKEYASIDDQILIKSSGMPTYHMANVVDDHLMGITHVIRGEEWISSTPKHILLYERFDWDPPEFIHMPLLLNPNGSKLSKRKNPTSVLYYRDAGFLPEALLNFLGLMGYSFPGDEEKTTVDEMIASFDIDRISLGGSIFDIKKLLWLNGRYIRENLEPKELLERLKEWRFNDSFIGNVIPLMHKRMETLGDFMPKVGFLFTHDVSYDTESLVPHGRESADIPAVIQTLLWSFENQTEWTPSSIESAIKTVVTFWNWPVRDITGILFTVIMGASVGPPLYESMEILGRDLSRARVLSALELMGGISRNRTKSLEKEWTHFIVHYEGKTPGTS